MQAAPTQDQQIRLIVAKLALVSHGQTQSWNSAGGGGDHDIPAAFEPPHERYARLYLKADTFDERQDVIEQANQEWLDLTGMAHKERPAGETADEFNQRIVKEGEGLTVKECTLKFKCSERQARNARKTHEVNVETGHRLEDLPDENADAATTARAMKARGMTVRAIGMSLRKDPKQIQRWLKAA